MTTAFDLDSPLACADRQAAMRSLAPQLVQAAYRGVLDRDADVEGLQLYAQMLDDVGDIAPVLRHLANSREHWRQLFASRADAVAGQLTQALLGDRSDPALHAQCLRDLRDPDDVAAAARGLAASDTHWRAQLALRADAIAQAAYQALLGRSPDAAEQAEAVADLRHAGGLEPMLARIVRYESLWPRMLKLQSREIARQLLGRDATDAEHADGVAALADPEQLGRWISTLTDSDSHWSTQLARRGADVVDDIYRALLGRAADSDGAAGYLRQVAAPGGLHHVIRSVGHSDEHARRLARPAGASAPDNGWGPVAAIDRAFVRQAGRRATIDDVTAILRDREPLGRRTRNARRESAGAGIVDAAIRPKRVLLFGAFGNGNLGDAYQAMAVRHLAITALDLPADAVFATSFLGDDFDFPQKQKLGRHAIVDAEQVNGFDLLIIGGGGLLAHPHRPLMDPDWVAALDLPIVLFAVGASPALVDEHRALLGKCWSLSARDQPSLRALRSVRPDARRVADPIFCVGDASLLRADCAAAAPAAADPAATETLWIVKHPSGAADEALLDRFADHLAGAPDAAARLVAIEPHLDHALERWFPGRVAYLRDAADLAGHLAASRQVVTMRYHGAVFAAMAGRRSLGCSQPKIGELYLEPGVHGEYFDDGAALLQRLQTPAPVAVAAPDRAAGDEAGLARGRLEQACAALRDAVGADADAVAAGAAPSAAAG